MIKFISGTQTYYIPLPQGNKLKSSYPLEITQSEDNWVIWCPYFEEYGYGKTFDEALNDLGQSLVDLKESLRRHDNLGDNLQVILQRLNENITKVKS